MTQSKLSRSIWSLSLDEFHGQLGSSAPTPGCGATVAVSLALSGALLLMCLEISAKQHADDLRIRGWRERAQSVIDVLKGSADEDIAAFQSLVATGGLPKSSEAERAVRDSARREALLASIRPPLACAQAALSLSEIAVESYAVIPIKVLPEFATALRQITACFHSALLIVETNARPLQEDLGLPESQWTALASQMSQVQRLETILSEISDRVLSKS